MKHVLFIMIGGSIGALSRYYISRYINDASGSIFPYGTLAVNVLGCLIIGFLFDLFENIIVDPSTRALLTVGFLGALTTFSTYSLETVNLIRSGELKYSLLYIFSNNITGFLSVIAGIFASRIFIKILR